MAISFEQGTIEEAIAVEAGIPEFGGARTTAQYLERLDGKPHLILVAWDRYEYGARPVGYKVGYQLEETVFYSWLGGVLPDFRRLGLAQQLLEMQEEWVQQQGYVTARVKSMNRHPGMLMLLIRNGYKIVDLEGPSGVGNPNPDETRILFQKVFS